MALWSFKFPHPYLEMLFKYILATLFTTSVFRRPTFLTWVFWFHCRKTRYPVIKPLIINVAIFRVSSTCPLEFCFNCPSYNISNFPDGANLCYFFFVIFVLSYYCWALTHRIYWLVRYLFHHVSVSSPLSFFCVSHSFQFLIVCPSCFLC